MCTWICTCILSDLSCSTNFNSIYLFARFNFKKPLQVMGRNRQNRPVFFEGAIDELKGKFANVLVEEARPWSLTGTQTGGGW